MCHQKWTTTYPKPKSLPQTPKTRHHVNLPEDRAISFPTGFSSGLPELRGAWTPTSPILFKASCIVVTVLFTLRASAIACGSEGQRTRRSTGAGAKEARALGSYGMHLLLWVGEPKVTTELVDVDYRWVFWHHCARIHSNSDRVISRWCWGLCFEEMKFERLMCVRLGALIDFATPSSPYKPDECDVWKVYIYK